jgi:hypothetical protein
MTEEMIDVAVSFQISIGNRPILRVRRHEEHSPIRGAFIVPSGIRRSRRPDLNLLPGVRTPTRLPDGGVENLTQALRVTALIDPDPHVELLEAAAHCLMSDG